MDTKELKIAVAGTGYVGLSIATLLSQHHQVMVAGVPGFTRIEGEHSSDHPEFHIFLNTTMTITALDLRKEHPQFVVSLTNRDYAGIANRILYLLHTSDFGFERILEELKAMAVNFTLYFEDIVSKVGLWHSFVAGHSNLYRKPLSFYRVGEDYTTDEIHSRIYSFSYGMPHLQARTLRHWSIWRTNPLPR